MPIGSQASLWRYFEGSLAIPFPEDKPQSCPEASGARTHKTPGTDMTVVQAVGFVFGLRKVRPIISRGRAIGHRPGDGEMIPPAQVDHLEGCRCWPGRQSGGPPVGQVDAQQVTITPSAYSGSRMKGCRRNGANCNRSLRWPTTTGQWGRY